LSSTQISYKRPWVYDKQREAIFCEERYGVIEASTKAGKTVGCIIWMVEQAIRGKPGQNFWWVAPVYSQTEIAFRRMKRALPLDLYDSNESKMTITLIPFDTTIWFKSAERPDGLYGEDVFAAVADEATRIKTEAWHALRSTLTATRGPIRVIGNVKGRRNWAYKLARQAQSGSPNMHYSKLTAWDAVEAGVLDQSEVEDARNRLPEAIFRELYLAEPGDDQGNPFGIPNIAQCVIPALSSKDPVVWGWDLAKSQDWTVGIGLDDEGKVCRFVRFQQPWEYTFRQILGHCNGVPALLDSTGVGDPIVERLQREGGAYFQGFKITGPSKQQLMEGLAVVIQRQQIGFPDSGEERHIRAELDAFEYEITRTGVRYEAPAGLHDDCVVALALAVLHKQTMTSYMTTAVPISYERPSPWKT
jgi:hypothetical protein